MNTMKTGILLALVLLAGGAFTLRAQAGPWVLQSQMQEVGENKRLKQPMGITFDAGEGRYYVADAGNGALVAFDEEGGYVAALRGGDRLDTPVSLARTDSGKFWVVNRSGNELFYIDPKKRDVRTFSLASLAGRPVLAGQVALGPDDSLFVLDRLGGGILRLDDDLKVVRTFRGGAGCRGFSDFKIRQGRLWALDGLGKAVCVFDLDGKIERTIALKDRELQFPVSLEIDGGGRLYLLDRHAGVIRVYDPQGRLQYEFLNRGKGRGELWYPTQVLFDWKDRLCVVDEGSGKAEVYARQ